MSIADITKSIVLYNAQSVAQPTRSPESVAHRNAARGASPYYDPTVSEAQSLHNNPSVMHGISQNIPASNLEPTGENVLLDVLSYLKLVHGDVKAIHSLSKQTLEANLEDYLRNRQDKLQMHEDAAEEAMWKSRVLSALEDMANRSTNTASGISPSVSGSTGSGLGIIPEAILGGALGSKFIGRGATIAGAAASAAKGSKIASTTAKGSRISGFLGKTGAKAKTGLSTLNKLKNKVPGSKLLGKASKLGGKVVKKLPLVATGLTVYSEVNRAIQQGDGVDGVARSLAAALASWGGLLEPSVIRRSIDEAIKTIGTGKNPLSWLKASGILSEGYANAAVTGMQSIVSLGNEIIGDEENAAIVNSIDVEKAIADIPYHLLYGQRPFKSDTDKTPIKYDDFTAPRLSRLSDDALQRFIATKETAIATGSQGIDSESGFIGHDRLNFERQSLEAAQDELNRRRFRGGAPTLDTSKLISDTSLTSTPQLKERIEKIRKKLSSTPWQLKGSQDWNRSKEELDTLVEIYRQRLQRIQAAPVGMELMRVQDQSIQIQEWKEKQSQSNGSTIIAPQSNIQNSSHTSMITNPANYNDTSPDIHHRQARNAPSGF